MRLSALQFRDRKPDSICAASNYLFEVDDNKNSRNVTSVSSETRGDLMSR